MNDLMFWAISHGITVMLEPCNCGCNQTMLTVSYVSGPTTIVKIHKFASKGLDKAILNKVIASEIEFIQDLAGLPKYIIHAGYRNN